MKKIFYLLLAPLFTIAQTTNDDATLLRKLADEVMVNGKAYDNLRYLTKQIGGRLAGSPQYNLASAWGKKVMEEQGADKVWLQECMVPHWVRGGVDKAEIVLLDGKKTKRPLDVVALGNSLGSDTKGIQAPVVAVANYDELERRKDELKGKIVFYNFKFNPTNIRPGTSYGQSGIYRRNGASRAAKYGAVGVIVRSLTEGTNNHPHTGAMAYNDSFPKIPALAVGIEDADYLWNAAKQSSLTVKLTTHGYFLPDTINHNVIGELIGTETPEKIITIGGHLDSWDNCEGAHDDGAGVVQTMEVLRALKAIGYKPKCTIRFVLFANEENGLRGGQKYADEAKANNEQHVFALESDAGGFSPRGFGFTMSKDKLDNIQPWLTLLKPYGTMELSDGGGGADIGPLNKAFGTPVAGLSPDGQRYFDHHHARNDTFEAVNKRELLLGALNMAALVYLVDKYGL